ncbi:MAG: hypothetical protein JSS89_05760 [Bacteroidetes bacterium]|nr:hypothetical protein [Bacteroidota bacterium]
MLLASYCDVIAQDSAIARPQIITSGVRASRISETGTFEIQGIRLRLPTSTIDTSMHPRIEDVTLRMVKNAVRSTVASMQSLRIEIDRALYIKETDSYSVRCYVANVSKPIAAGTLQGTCTLELTAVAVWNERRSDVATKTFVVNVAN